MLGDRSEQLTRPPVWYAHSSLAQRSVAPRKLRFTGCCANAVAARSTAAGSTFGDILGAELQTSSRRAAG